MTTLQKYETLRSRVNAVLYPDGVPREKQIVRINDFRYPESAEEYINNIATWCDIVSVQIAPAHDKKVWCLLVANTESPLTLQMLLRAFQKQNNSKVLTEKFAGDVIFRGFDLSRSVDEQDEAVLDFLLEIIK